MLQSETGRVESILFDKLCYELKAIFNSYPLRDEIAENIIEFLKNDNNDSQKSSFEKINTLVEFL